MTRPADSGSSVPRLYHAASSYYSMIARLALVETGRPFVPVAVDIHRRLAQFAPAYVQLNPNMTVPTLVAGDRVLADSRAIVVDAFGRSPEGLDDETARWLSVHGAFPIEQLTFGWLMRRHRLLRRAMPRKLAAEEGRLRALAQEHPELAEAYLRRADVFAARRRTFDPARIDEVFEAQRSAALGHLDALDTALADGRTTLVRTGYGPADVVWSVFLARLHWVRLDGEITRRSTVARYAEAMFARPSFGRADVWRRLKVLAMIRQLF